MTNPTTSTPISFIKTHHQEHMQQQPQPPHIYTISTLNALVSNHTAKLSDTTNIFYIKSVHSSMIYDRQLKYWTLLIRNDQTHDQNAPNTPNAQTPTIAQPFPHWIPITSCLESIHGSGGYLSRYITIYLEQTFDQTGEITLGIPPLYFSIGTSLALGKRVGVSKLNTLLFSCSINPGEVAQFFIKPNFVNVPQLKRIWYKFKAKKLHYVGLNFIKSFKMFVVDTPENQCWVSRNIDDLQCGGGKPLANVDEEDGYSKIRIQL
ncbi:hypothetical protein CANMA_002475 [Candida margitis]|uniref:uncharacterized protein n=1 Tax=Candida margitis TaxID=1775924 RepID=UPI002226150A|nr:uncharacterized protein CANMA_002475 [Candida margitis]KAI5968259.1 hypothetical protein CANMA_002475 [Candida margitis]